MGTDHDAAEQQSYNPREPDTASEWWNTENKGHSQGELRQWLQRCSLRSKVIQTFPCS
jgi:hypothetical protein